ARNAEGIAENCCWIVLIAADVDVDTTRTEIKCGDTDPKTAGGIGGINGRAVAHGDVDCTIANIGAEKPDQVGVNGDVVSYFEIGRTGTDRHRRTADEWRIDIGVDVDG